MVSLCLPSDAFSQHLLYYLGFSYLGRGVSLHGCSSKVQLLLLTLEEGYLIRAAPPDLERGVAALGPPVPWQPGALGRCPWPWARGRSSRPCFCVVHPSRSALSFNIVVHYKMFTMRFLITICDHMKSIQYYRLYSICHTLHPCDIYKWRFLLNPLP